MFVLGVLSVIIGSSGAGYTSDSATVHVRPSEAAVADTNRVPSTDTALARLLAIPAPADTHRVRPRPRAIETSDWYSRRLTIHRYVAYATIPVFAAQYAAGDQLFKKGRDAPTWAKTTHRVGATALAGMFTVNTVTGVWNWWDSRTVKQGRVLRTIHALSILGADAAFTYAGAKLSDEAETSLDKRRLHRTIALSAIGVTVVSGVAMKLWNR
jgi:hypothetical protein